MILNANNFEKEVLKADLPVLVDFWASWCPPCKMVEQVVEELGRELAGRVKVGKLNVDQNPGIASRYDIKGVPTFVLFVEGKEVARRVERGSGWLRLGAARRSLKGLPILMVDYLIRERAIRIGGLEFLDSRAADVERSMGVGPVETWTEVTIAGRQVRLFILDYDPLIAPLADRRVAMGSPSLFAFVFDSTGNVTQFYSGCWDFFVDRSRSILELTVQLNENITTYANKQYMVEGSHPLAETIPWAGEVVFTDLCKDDRVFITFRVNGGAVSGDQSVMQIVELRVDGEYLGPIVNILKR